MVGLIEKSEHITTQWFKDDGDAIVLLGDAVDASDSLQGLGGSAYLQVVHGKKTGLPPRCDLAKEKSLHDFTRSIIKEGLVKSAHDCSEGGLAVAIAESCISQNHGRHTPRLIGAQVDLSAFKGLRLDALLFGETQARIVISTAADNADQVLAQAAKAGVSAKLIGKVGGTQLKLKTAKGAKSWPLPEIHDLWWNTIARAMR